MSPVDPYFVALIIAFGAGCLMFAVTVELYGEQLMHLEHHKHQEGVMEVIICLVAAFAGSLAYISLNRWVEGMEGEGEDEHEVRDADGRQCRRSYACARYACRNRRRRSTG